MNKVEYFVCVGNIIRGDRIINSPVLRLSAAVFNLKDDTFYYNIDVARIIEKTYEYYPELTISKTKEGLPTYEEVLSDVRSTISEYNLGIYKELTQEQFELYLNSPEETPEEG